MPAEREEDIDRMLRVGVYHVLEDDDTQARQFCERDIEDILKTTLE